MDINQTDFKKSELISYDPEIEAKKEIHSKLCDKIKKLYAEKNADYGDSMHPLFQEYGLTAFTVLFDIKVNRIKTLQHKQGHFESIEDSLMDLANYSLIAMTELQRAKETDNKNI